MEPITSVIFRLMRDGDPGAADKTLEEYGAYMRQRGVEEERTRIKTLVNGHRHDRMATDGGDTPRAYAEGVETVVNTILAHIDREPQPEVTNAAPDHR